MEFVGGNSMKLIRVTCKDAKLSVGGGYKKLYQYVKQLIAQSGKKINLSSFLLNPGDPYHGGTVNVKWPKQYSYTSIVTMENSQYPSSANFKPEEINKAMAHAKKEFEKFLKTENK